MTTHEAFEEQLSEYIDGGLTVDGERAVAAHLAECTACQRTLRELEAVVRTAAALPQIGPSTDLWESIGSRLDTAATRPAPSGGTWRFTFSLPQLAAASVAVAVLSGWAATLMAGALVCMAPLVLVFLLLRRQFFAGIASSGLKG